MQSILIQTLFRPARRRMRFRTAFVLYFLILILGSLPHAREEIGTFASGPVLHSIAYAIITFLLATGADRRPLAQSMQAFLIVVVMGALDECVQSFFPYRTAAVSDWLVDCSASLIMASILLPPHMKLARG
ncbi:MAG: VanZ family protein [Herminiimonas sp.]|nr:VanZ family protein [Herminiimonas sp.]